MGIVLDKLPSQPGLVEQVYDAILEGICDGQFAPAERLAQERIAEMLHVSRQPVAQALGLLRAQGFVCDAGRRGLMVAPLDVDFVQALYEYRGAIDLVAAGKAACICTREMAICGQKIIEQGRAAAKAGSISRLSDADTAFHQWMYETAGNQILVETMEHYWKHMRRVRSAVFSLDNSWPAIMWDEHEAILSAVVAGKRELAEQLARTHVAKASQALLQQLKLIGNNDKHIVGQGDASTGDAI